MFRINWPVKCFHAHFAPKTNAMFLKMSKKIPDRVAGKGMSVHRGCGTEGVSANRGVWLNTPLPQDGYCHGQYASYWNTYV